MNIFEKAVRNRHRYATRKGNLTVEDLLGLSLQSLDRVGKTILKNIKDHEDSLIGGVSTNMNEEKLDVVKHIIREKQLGLQTPDISHLLDAGEEVL